jgi:hypothetical protein
VVGAGGVGVGGVRGVVGGGAKAALRVTWAQDVQDVHGAYTQMPITKGIEQGVLWKVRPPELDPGPRAPAARPDEVLVEDVDSDEEDDELNVVQDQSEIPAGRRTTIDSMLEKMDATFPSDLVGARRNKARAALERAFTRADHDCGVEAAVREAGDFQFDPLALQRDLDEFNASGRNLEKMVAERRR